MHLWWLICHQNITQMVDVQQLPLQVLDDKVLPMLKGLIAEGDDLDLVVEIKQGLFAFPYFQPHFLLVLLDVNESKPQLNGINKFLSLGHR